MSLSIDEIVTAERRAMESVFVAMLRLDLTWEQVFANWEPRDDGTMAEVICNCLKFSDQHDPACPNFWEDHA